MMNFVSTIGKQTSAVIGSVMFARTQSAAKIRAVSVFALTGLAFTALGAGVAEASGNPAGDFNSYVSSVSGKTNKVVDVISYISYIGGAAFTALGIVDLKKHIENPSQVQLKTPLSKLVGGALLLAVPYMSSVLFATGGGTGSASFQKFNAPPTL